MTDLHQDTVVRAQATLREARAALETFTANMDWSHPQNDTYLAALRLKVEQAERAVANAEHALRCAEALERAAALGM